MNQDYSKSTSLKRIGLFILLTFGISSLIMGIYHLHLFEEVNEKLVYLAAAGPTLGTLLTLVIFKGKKGAGQFLSYFTHWKSSIWYYLAACFLMPVILMFSAYIFPVEGVNWTSNLAEKLPSLVPVFLILTIQAGLGEEIGWRGFLTTEWNKLVPLDMASILTGIIWGFWHLPLFLTPGWFQANLVLQIGFLPAFLGYMLFLVASSVIYSFFYQKAKGNIWIPILFHGSLNTATWLVEGNRIQENIFSLYINTLTVTLIALVILIYGRLKSRLQTRP